MKFRLAFCFVALTRSASAALAVDFGVRGGYYGNDLKEAFVGADLRVPIGPVAIIPNVDHSHKGDVDYWFFNGDLALSYQTGRGPSYWFGGGPSYG